MSQPFRVAIFVSLLIINGTALAFCRPLAKKLASGHLIAQKFGNGVSERYVFTLQAVALTAQAVVRVLESEIFEFDFVD